MSVELLNSLKQQAATLTDQEKSILANFLLSQSNGESYSEPYTTVRPITTEELDEESRAVKRQQHMEWLKTHREEYAGQFVALDGNNLVGAGKTFREATEQAKQKAVRHALVVRVISEKEVLFGGW
jgi:hypothetical protein